MFLGSAVSSILDMVEKVDSISKISIDGKEKITLDIAQIPELTLDNTDRNRTSPFAFTGNRFEYRAVGSSANNASALIALNAAVAAQLDDFANVVEARVAKGEDPEAAILAEVKKLLAESKAIHFDGNGYSEEWKQEAARRGLDVETSAPLMYDSYTRPDTIEMFEKTGVLSRKEIEARNEEKKELYERSGWHVVGDYNSDLVVVCTDDPDAPEIYTDPELLVKPLKKISSKLLASWLIFWLCPAG